MCGFETDLLKLIRMLHAKARNADITQAASVMSVFLALACTIRILPLLPMLSAVFARREAHYQGTADTLLQETTRQLIVVPVVPATPQGTANASWYESSPQRC